MSTTSTHLSSVHTKPTALIADVQQTRDALALGFIKALAPVELFQTTIQVGLTALWELLQQLAPDNGWLSTPDANGLIQQGELPFNSSMPILEAEMCSEHPQNSDAVVSLWVRYLNRDAECALYPQQGPQPVFALSLSSVHAFCFTLQHNRVLQGVAQHSATHNSQPLFAYTLKQYGAQDIISHLEYQAFCQFAAPSVSDGITRQDPRPHTLFTRLVKVHLHANNQNAAEQ